MPLDPDTPCTSCGGRIWVHRLVGLKAMCAPRTPSPNLQAPEVAQARQTLGHKISYELFRHARLIEEQRAKEAQQ